MKNTVALIFSMAFSIGASATDYEAAVVIKDHRFIPSDIRVAAGQKIKLIIDNQDATPEEFESHDLNREKVIPGKSKATIFIGPLKVGTYSFAGEFNEATAKGTIAAE